MGDQAAVVRADLAVGAGLIAFAIFCRYRISKKLKRSDTRKG